MNKLQAELQRKERAIGRKVQVLAKGLARLMEPGSHLHRIGVGLHAFDADGAVCLAAPTSKPKATTTATPMRSSAVGRPPNAPSAPLSSTGVIVTTPVSGRRIALATT